MQTNANTVKLQKTSKAQRQAMPECKSKANKPVKHDKRNHWKEA